MRARLEADFHRFAGGLPPDFPRYVRDAYRIDLTARYLGTPIPHPIGKGSGQLSLNREQLETDAEAGLAFVVLKTVIAQDASGAQSMGAWAIHETRMTVEQIPSQSGKMGWTTTWKGRGWDRSFGEYLDLVRAGRELTQAGRLLVVPSVKYHLPREDEPFRTEEYGFTTRSLIEAWGPEPLFLEKDFSPTLAGADLADERERILRWIREVPRQVHAAAGREIRLGLKLMNARFDDQFQVAMLEAAASSGAAAAIGFNRLFDPARQVAYGGWDLSDRNLRVLGGWNGPTSLELSGTGNICTGLVVLDYARLGCTSAQLHTYFQLPLREYPARGGSRTTRALHSLIFHPDHGLIRGMLDLEAGGRLERRGQELRFLDIAEHRAHHQG